MGIPFYLRPKSTILNVGVAKSWNQRKYQIYDLTGQIIDGVTAKYSNCSSKPRYKIHSSVYQDFFPIVDIRVNKIPWQCKKCSTPLVIIAHCRNINSTGPMSVRYSIIDIHCTVKIFFHTRVHCRKEIGDFQIICSKVSGFRPFNYLLGVRCYLLSLKCKWLVLNKLCNFTAYKLFVSTNKQLTDPMDSMADPLFSSYSEALFFL